MAADGDARRGARPADDYSAFAAQVRAQREEREEQARLRRQVEQARIAAGRTPPVSPTTLPPAGRRTASAVRLAPLRDPGAREARQRILRPANED